MDEQLVKYQIPNLRDVHTRILGVFLGLSQCLPRPMWLVVLCVAGLSGAFGRVEIYCDAAGYTQLGMLSLFSVGLICFALGMLACHDLPTHDAPSRHVRIGYWMGIVGIGEMCVALVALLGEASAYVGEPGARLVVSFIV